MIECLLARVCTDVGLIYFFCDHQDPKKQSFRNFVGSGISQLLYQAPDCIEDARDFYTRKKEEPGEDKGAKPSIGECVQLLKAFTLHFTEVFVIVDALDECEEIGGFLAGLNELRCSTNTKTTAQVLITSRQEVDIERQMQQCLTESICLSDNIGPDIRRFITDQEHVLLSTGKLKLRDPSLRTQIITALCNGADGM